MAPRFYAMGLEASDRAMPTSGNTAPPLANSKFEALGALPSGP